MPQQPTVTLTDGASMPQLGFGVFQVPHDETAAAVTEALRVGYRSIDTAAMYRNEAAVGAALASSDLDRDEVFVTTKLNNDGHGYEQARKACQESLERLGLEQLDLYLIHWPLPAQDRYVETWRAFIDLQRDGLARSIGVSNFQPAHVERLLDETGVTPAVNQVELHPYFTQQELREFDATHGIATEAWSPLGRGGELLSDEVLVSLAEKYGATPAQVVLAWHLHIGNVVIPKSVTPSRIAENFAALEIDLDPDDANAISDLDRDGRIGPDPDQMGR